MHKCSSILDYPWSGLDPSVWDKELKLYSFQKDFILRLIEELSRGSSFTYPSEAVKDITIIGSLTTNRWLLESDLDVHIVVDIASFQQNYRKDSSYEEVVAYLDNLRKEWNKTKLILPMTQHPIEIYFEDRTTNPSNLESVGCYSMVSNKWEKPPVVFDASLDIEECKKQVLEQAEDLAQELDGSFGKIRRDIKRIDEFYQVITSWKPEIQKQFYDKIYSKVQDIEQEIKRSIGIKQELVDERHRKQNPSSDNEIIFKYLARYGFFTILQDLKDLLMINGGEISIDELPLVKTIISKVVNQPKPKTINFRGLEIVIEWPTGSTRTFDRSDAKRLMKADYGRIDGTKGKDKEEFDVYVNQDGKDSTNVFKVKQVSKDGKVDEYKYMLGFENEEKAKEMYLEHMPEDLFGGIESIPFDKFVESVERNQEKHEDVEACLREASSHGAGGWISPTGEFINTDDHNRFMWDHPEVFGVDLSGRDPRDSTEWDDRVQREALSRGWVMVRIWGKKLYIYTDAFEKAKVAEDFVYSHLDDVDAIFVLNPESRINADKVMSSSQEFRETGWDSFQKTHQDVWASKKQASSVLKVPREGNTDVLVHENPTLEQVTNLFERSKGKMLRWAQIGRKLYVWDAYDLIHEDALEGLGYDLSKQIYDKGEWNKVYGWGGIRDFFGVTSDPVETEQPYKSKFTPEMEKILDDELLDELMGNNVGAKQARLFGNTFREEKLWFDPSGQVYPVGGSACHASWILDNAKLLKEEYGFDSSKWALDSEGLISDYEGIDNALVSTGWARVGDMHNGWGIQVKDLYHVPEYLAGNYLQGSSGSVIIEDLNKNWVEVSVEDFITQGQKAVNRALSSKRLGKMAFAVKTASTFYHGTSSTDFSEFNGDIVYLSTSLEDAEMFASDSVIGGGRGQGTPRVLVVNARDGKVKDINAPVEEAVMDGDVDDCIASETEKARAEGYRYVSFSHPGATGDAFTATVSLYPREDLEIVSENKKQANQEEFPQAGSVVDGRTVLDGVPNTSSIGASLSDYEVLHGIREVPFSAFTQMPLLSYYSTDEEQRTKNLAEQIKESGEIAPLIVVVDKEGPYILEGGHRFDALRELGANSFPALVVLDLESIGKQASSSVVEVGKVDIGNKVVPVVVPEDLLNKYIEVVKRFQSIPWTTQKENLDVLNKLDKERRTIHDQLVNFSLKQLFSKGIPRSAKNLFNKVRDVISNMVEEFLFSMGENKRHAAFLPSLVNAPDNAWQFAEGGPNLEIPVDPDAQSDEITFFDPCNTGKPRKPTMWDEIIPMMKKPFSKKELDKESSPPPVADYKRENIKPLGFTEFMAFRDIAPQEVQDEVDALIEGNLFQQATAIMEKYLGRRHLRFANRSKEAIEEFDEEVEKKELGEDETLLEYEKGFPDPTKKDRVNNTTWDAEIPGQREPFSPLRPNYTHETNPDNLGQPGVRRFFAPPKGEEYSNEGEVNNFLIKMFENKKACISRLTKQAGSYSSVYSDEQGEQFFNEQHHNDVSEEPYVDHNNRDYPFGMRDMNDSTTDYPKPEDIEPYVCRLDQLQKPFFREYAPGIGSYNIIFYLANPMSDGIEATNPS